MSNKLKVVFMENALDFIESMPTSAADKLLEIIKRIEGGEQNSKLFKKT